jgi:DNA-binding response OmpR family regulator
MKRTVLLVEDEPPIAEVVEMYLEQAGFKVRWVTTGRDAVKQMADPSVELVLLDLMLPDADGIDVFKELRAQRDVPVIMLTARDSEGDRVLGLEIGADDYVPKPFSPRELVARVRTVLRRRESTGAQDGPVTAGRLHIDPERREVLVDGEAVELTRKEFDVLIYLLQRAGRVLTRAQLLEAVWGYPGDVDSRTVDVHIAQLRRKLGDDCPVRTIRGVGYKAEA